MTENKRFSYEIENFKEELSQYNRSGLVKLLLKMKEENEQLKFWLKECQEHKLFSRRELEKENEQLKSENMAVTGANKILKENNTRLQEEIKDLNDVLARYEEKYGDDRND